MITKEQFITRAKELRTLLNTGNRLDILYNCARRTSGEIWECGVYKGGSAYALSGFNRTLRLFDTWEGMPETMPIDAGHDKGDFNDCSLEIVKQKIVGEHVYFYKGFIPNTFKGLENCKIGFAHVDVDIYQSVKDCCEFIVPRLSSGGIILFDDYGFSSCPGAKLACDEFFGDDLFKLTSLQAVYVKP